MVGRGISHPQEPVDIEGIARERNLFLEGEHHLEDVSVHDVLLGALHALQEVLPRGSGRLGKAAFPLAQGNGARGTHDAFEAVQASDGVIVGFPWGPVLVQHGVGDEHNAAFHVIEDHQIIEAIERRVRQFEGIVLHGHALRGGGAVVAQVADVAAAEAGQAGGFVGLEGGQTRFQECGKAAFLGDDVVPGAGRGSMARGRDPLAGVHPEDAVAGHVTAAFDAFEKEAPFTGAARGQVDGHGREGVRREGAGQWDDVEVLRELFEGRNVHRACLQESQDKKKRARR